MKIGIMGCGAYGISLAVNLYKNNQVMLWTALEEEKDVILKTRYNDDMLKGIYIDENILVTTSIDELMTNNIIFLVIPVKFVKDTLLKIKKLASNQIFVIASKGIVDGLVLSDYVKQELKTDKIGILSGGTFAIDLANYSYSGLTVCGNNEVRNVLKGIFNLDHIKLDESDDLKGVELVAAIKNTMAITMGIIDNLDVSHTTKCMVLTDIIKDLNKIVISLGGDEKTILTYAGIGDTLLTCTSNKSRNFTFGKLLVENREKAYQFLENNTVEGVNTLDEINKILKNKNINIESIIKLNAIINEEADPKYILEK